MTYSDPEAANAAKRRWNHANAEKRAEQVKWAKIKQKWHLTREEWESLFDRQGRVCAVCLTDTPTLKGWSIDHDHSCCPGQGSCGRCIRGILCGRCNTALGYMQDDPVRLRAAADYLENTQAPGIAEGLSVTKTILG